MRKRAAEYIFISDHALDGTRTLARGGAERRLNGAKTADCAPAASPTIPHAVAARIIGE